MDDRIAETELKNQRRTIIKIFYRKSRGNRFQEICCMDDVDDITGAIMFYVRETVDEAILYNDTSVEGEYYATSEDIDTSEVIAESSIVSVRYKDGDWVIE